MTSNISRHISNFLELRSGYREEGDPGVPDNPHPLLAGSFSLNYMKSTSSLMEACHHCLVLIQASRGLKHRMPSMFTVNCVYNRFGKSNKSSCQRRTAVLMRSPCICFYKSGSYLVLPSHCLFSFWRGAG